ncbi:unnamed protein product [Microthlaspi erraticum]|uniref:NYN domain-containing protein n=1 Tax=Microthlaspi erraticum TaxID=1685480 RepID=A0A6D2J871_9BRAS|nr:unnamed protein product [Microthlaspi erraticum]
MSIKEQEMNIISGVAVHSSSRPVYSEHSHKRTLEECYNIAKKYVDKSEDEITLLDYSYEIDKLEDHKIIGPVKRRKMNTGYTFAQVNELVKNAMASKSLMTSRPNWQPKFSMEDYAIAKTVILHDIENCQYPKNCDPLLITKFAEYAKMALVQAGFTGPIHDFYGVGDVDMVFGPPWSEKRRAIESSGIILIDVPKRFNSDGTPVKDLADKELMNRMFNWVCHNLIPANIVLASSDKDYLRALHTLENNGGINPVVVHGPDQSTAEEMRNRTSIAFYWDSFYRGGAPYRKKTA